MSETKKVEEQKPEKMQNVDFHAPDHLLQHLVGVANDAGISMGITLYVSGAVVSGTLIGGGHFFELMKEAVEGDNVNPKIKEGFGGMFDSYAKIYTAPPEIRSAPSFIHLMGAKVFMPGQPPMPTAGMLWRGRITSVSGFSLGSFSVS